MCLFTETNDIKERVLMLATIVSDPERPYLSNSIFAYNIDKDQFVNEFVFINTIFKGGLCTLLYSSLL